MTASQETKHTLQLDLSRDLYTNTDCHFVGILSPKSKRLLTLPEEERKGGALADLLSEMENIEFFKMFSNHAKEMLAKKLIFVTHRADEFLLRQGETDEPPQAMFIIMSGVVTELYKPSENPGSPKVVWPEKILRKGEFFGHVDIVLRRPPSVDAQTVGYSELLMLGKGDFGIVEKVMEAHSSRVRHYLRTTEAISKFGWSEEEHKVLEIFSKLCTYAENQEIYGHTISKKPFWSYFIVSGECKVVRELSYNVAESGHMKADSGKESKGDNVVHDRIELEEVKHGYFFGVGEDFSRNHVVASSTLECVLIPRLLLLFKDRELLQKMASDLTHSLPSDQEVLDSYSKLVCASEKKIEMFKEMFKDKPERLTLS